MSRRRGSVRVRWLAAPALLIMAGCATARMPVPAGLETADVLGVEGRGGWREGDVIRFGGFVASSIDRSWTKGSGMGTSAGRLGGNKVEARQGYRFAFEGEAAVTWVVECETSGSRGTVGIGSVEIDASAQERLDCVLTPEPVADGGPGWAAGPGLAPISGAWTLSLRSDRDPPLEGRATGPSGEYQVVAKRTGNRFVPGMLQGFEVRRGETIVAGVETVNDGSVRLAAGLSSSDRDVLASLAATLLLYRELPTD